MLRFWLFVRAEGIEPPALFTSRRCSTTELSARWRNYTFFSPFFKVQIWSGKFTNWCICSPSHTNCRYGRIVLFG